jgi:hypothetical protein
MGTSTPLDEDHGPPSQAGLTSALQFIATIGSPIALVTVLLFYFGWVRSDVQARELGYDVSLLALSSQDYVLRSINILFFPFVFVLLVALCLNLLHGRIISRIEQSNGIRTITRAARVLKLSWLVTPMLGLILVVFMPSVGVVILPMMFALGILGTLYGVALQRRLSRDQSRSSVLTQSLIVALLAVTLFWSTERVAGAMGAAFADYIAANPGKLISVTIYSPKRLQITAPGVVETRFTDPKSAYEFRYSGLRLLQRSGSKYFLLYDGLDRGQSRVIVISDDSSMRFEFAH